MNKIQQYFAKRLLMQAINRRSPETISRSGSSGEAVNCFSTFMDQTHTDRRLLMVGLDGDVAKFLEWDGNSFVIPKDIPLRDIPAEAIRINHYYGLSDVRYRGVTDFIVGRLTGYPYLKVHAILIRDRISQYIFNKRRLVTKQRIEVLEVMVQKRLDGADALMTLDVMLALHGMQSIVHPGKDAYIEMLELYLDSLVDSGELQKIDGYKYRAIGKAIQTLERYEEEEARHTESRRIQYTTLLLSIVVAALTVIQAGLVKLPVLLDLSR